MPPAYTYTLSEAAADFAFHLPRKEQQRLARACRSLASTPSRRGDYVTRDHSDRPLQNLLLDDWVFTYWADDAAREMRITEIVQV